LTSNGENEGSSSNFAAEAPAVGWASSLSPAYDLTFARGGGYTRRHQISLGGKFDRFTAGDLLDLGRKFGIERDGREIVQEVGEALSGWPTAARKAGVPEDRIAAIGAAHRLDCIPEG
jgi:serine/threonine-protein kinase HipA